MEMELVRPVTAKPVKAVAGARKQMTRTKHRRWQKRWNGQIVRRCLIF
jgi:hypothetical protein